MAISLSSRYKGTVASAMPPAGSRGAVKGRSMRRGGKLFEQRAKLGGVQRLVEEEGRAELRRRPADIRAGMVAVDDLHEPGTRLVFRQLLEHAKPVALPQFEVQ